MVVMLTMLVLLVMLRGGSNGGVGDVDGGGDVVGGNVGDIVVVGDSVGGDAAAGSSRGLGIGNVF